MNNIFNFKRNFANSTYISTGDWNTLLYLRDNASNKDFFIIGTSHVSKKSAEEVKKVIDNVNPDSIFLELDEQRAHNIMSNNYTLKDAMPFMDSGPFSMFGKMLGKQGAMMKNISKIMGLQQGIEFKVAIEEAKRKNTNIVYGDIPFAETQQKLLKVAFAEIGNIMKNSSSIPPHIVERMREIFFSDDIEKSLEDIKNREFIASIGSTLKILSPPLYDIIIRDRDIHMSQKLKSCRGNMIVGVVGVAHLEGIEKFWNSSPITQN